MAWYLGVELGMGALDGWIGLSAEITVAALLLWWRLERRGWLGRAKVMRAQAVAQPGAATLAA